MSARAASVARVAVLALVLALGGPLVARAGASGVPAKRDAREPRTFESPSGAWSLTVTAEREDPNGSTRLALRREGKVAWRERLRHGVREVHVTDDGRVAGFGYGGGHAMESPSDLGEVLHVFLRAPDGEKLVDESHERHMTPHACGTCFPRASGCYVQPELGRFVMRVEELRQHGTQSWWAYDLASGAVLFRESLKLRLALAPALDAALGLTLDARPVPGTPLVLVQWLLWRGERPTQERGSCFQLVDHDWRVVWSREVVIPERELVQLQIEQWIDRPAARIEREGFALPLDVTGTRHARFAVRRAGEAWEVAEVGVQVEVAPDGPGPRAPAGD